MKVKKEFLKAVDQNSRCGKLIACAVFYQNFVAHDGKLTDHVKVAQLVTLGIEEKKISEILSIPVDAVNLIIFTIIESIA